MEKKWATFLMQIPTNDDGGILPTIRYCHIQRMILPLQSKRSDDCHARAHNKCLTH